MSERCGSVHWHRWPHPPGRLEGLRTIGDDGTVYELPGSAQTTSPLESPPQRDPRYVAVARAALAIREAAGEVMVKYELTYIELIRILAQKIDTWPAYAERAE